MLRFIASLAIGILIGTAAGVVLGWGPFAIEYSNSPASDLLQIYTDDYTVMVANAYELDNDTIGAVERLRILGVENIPLYVQTVTERYITTSRDLGDIQSMVKLSEALGRLTPIMEPYREVSLPEVSQ